MKRIQLEKRLKATPELLWELIVDPDFYRYWTAAFMEGSDFVGDWSEGSKIRFVVRDEDGLESGMLSEIAASEWPKHISVRHVGIIMNGVEDHDSRIAEIWRGAYENYTLIPEDAEHSRFLLEMDVDHTQEAEYRSYWQDAFNRMEKLLAESDAVGRVITLREDSHYSPEALWHRLTTPEAVKTWNHASDDWHCPRAENTLEIDGEFHYEMAARDGSMSFDFYGVFTEIVPPRRLSFILGDNRGVSIEIEPTAEGCRIVERFEAETMNSLHLQRQGWQSILRNLAK